MREQLAKVLKPLGSVIVAMYFDVDRGNEVKRESEDDQYSLFIYLLYTEENNPECLEKAQAVAKKIEGLFRARFYNPATQMWKNIELEGCAPISDQAMTYAQSVVLRRWNGDYISLRADPQESVPPD